MAWTVKRIRIECPYLGCGHVWSVALAAWRHHRCAVCPRCRQRIKDAWMNTGPMWVRKIRMVE